VKYGWFTRDAKITYCDKDFNCDWWKCQDGQMKPVSDSPERKACLQTIRQTVSEEHILDMTVETKAGMMQQKASDANCPADVKFIYLNAKKQERVKHKVR
jgi:hypothetical protein